MRATSVIIILLVVSPAFLLGDPPAKKSKATDPTAFEVQRGKSVQGFSYTSSGQLLYNSKPFSPPIGGSGDIPKFHISLSPNRAFAAAVGKDIDGQDTLHLLKLNVNTAIPLQHGGYKSVGGVIGTWWSPSGKYLIALCAYEGQRFVRANIKTGEVIDGPWLKPEGKVALWAVKGEPRWDGNTDVLRLIVNETCDPYDGDCGPDAVNAGKVLATHQVALDAETLAVRVK